jgi:CubicO group peptidase (beta-lactamase class C family)
MLGWCYKGAALVTALLMLGGCSAKAAVLDQAAPPVMLETAEPESVGMSAPALARIGAAVEQAIKAGDIPGAAVEVARQGKIVYRASFGARALYPKYQANSIDTVYDLASLTKPVGTATAIMKLVEQGKIRLWDRVGVYDPAFRRRGKNRVTVAELLEHSSGLPSALNERQSILPEAEGERLIDDMPLHFAPGSRYEYCNTCFIELAKILRVVAGNSLGDYSRRELFEPMGLEHALFFNPPPEERPRLSPEAEVRPGHYLLGRFVISGHGPIGAVGHAGLFATVDGLTAYAQMLLNGGTYNGHRILAPQTVAQMIAPRYLGRETQRIGNVRGLGWDEATTDSSNRGEIFGLGGFGHTGSTGCSLWIDPASQTVVVFLSNAAHIKRDNDDAVVRLYGRVTTLAAAAIDDNAVMGASAAQAARWGAQVAAQAPGFEQWAAQERRAWGKARKQSQY